MYSHPRCFLHSWAGIDMSSHHTLSRNKGEGLVNMGHVCNVSTIGASPQDSLAAEKAEFAGNQVPSAGPALPLVTQFLDSSFRHSIITYLLYGAQAG